MAKRALKLLETSEQEDADRIGEALRTAAKAHPGLFSNALSVHLDRPTTDAGMIAWSHLLEAEARVNDDGLTAAINELVHAAGEGEQGGDRRGGFSARPVGNSNFEHFVLAAVRHLLQEEPAASDDLVVALCRLPRARYISFVEPCEALILEKHRLDIHRAVRTEWFGGRDPDLPSIDFERVQKSIDVSEVAQLNILAADAAPDSRLSADYECTFVQLSAYHELTKWGDQPIGDGEYWIDEAGRSAETAVLRAATQAGIFDRERLAVEAASLLANRDAIKSYHSFAAFARTGRVDLPDIGWSAVPREAIDLKLFEAALHQGSYYLASIAMRILYDAQLAQDELRGIVSRTLENGTGYALWAAVNLADHLPAEDAVHLALARLERFAGPGAEYLPGIFEHHPIESSEQLERAMRPALINKRAKLARRAARALHGLGKASGTLRALLFEAITHWTANPPPVIRGSSEPNPRPAIADVLAAISEVSHAEVTRFLSYGRDYDGKGTVVDLAKSRWDEDAAFKQAVIDAVEQGLLERAVLREIFHVADPNS
eukprot:TRINITY_DN15455_c0_g1_i7.p1 TRINITY_DN15455_c0_g1~~TRINITY_DN15455_c0_g1_i7.p1  ORF type:complete len:546 (+),score=65.20 TRINITY_DN15455_c0_g1_i7:126-1763(+)